MVEIRLTNTKTRGKEVFAPIDPQNVRLYLCGPTVYDRAHLGNARPVVVIDVLVALLRHVYGADHVTYVRNFTDVDDKINATALARQQAGAPGSLEDLIHERTHETIGWYHADMDALGAARPDHEHARGLQLLLPRPADARQHDVARVAFDFVGRERGEGHGEGVVEPRRARKWLNAGPSPSPAPAPAGRCPRTIRRPP